MDTQEEETNGTQGQRELTRTPHGDPNEAHQMELEKKAPKRRRRSYSTSRM